MAILSGTNDGSNEIEVRVKKWPENTCFEEHIKIGDREKANARSCERYIVPEAGKQYKIEIILKAGYQWDFQQLRVELFFPNIEKPVSYERIYGLNYVDGKGNSSGDSRYMLHSTNRFEVNGRKLAGACFVFGALAVGMNHS